MNKYLDEKMIASLVVAAVIIFFVQHWLTKKVIDKHTGKMSAYIGNEHLGYTKI